MTPREIQAALAAIFRVVPTGDVAGGMAELVKLCLEQLHDERLRAALAEVDFVAAGRGLALGVIAAMSSAQSDLTAMYLGLDPINQVNGKGVELGLFRAGPQPQEDLRWLSGKMVRGAEVACPEMEQLFRATQEHLFAEYILGPSLLGLAVLAGLREANPKLLLNGAGEKLIVFGFHDGDLWPLARIKEGGVKCVVPEPPEVPDPLSDWVPPGVQAELDDWVDAWLSAARIASHPNPPSLLFVDRLTDRIRAIRREDLAERITSVAKADPIAAMLAASGANVMLAMPRGLPDFTSEFDGVGFEAELSARIEEFKSTPPFSDTRNLFEHPLSGALSGDLAKARESQGDDFARAAVERIASALQSKPISAREGGCLWARLAWEHRRLGDEERAQADLRNAIGCARHSRDPDAWGDLVGWAISEHWLREEVASAVVRWGLDRDGSAVALLWVAARRTEALQIITSLDVERRPHVCESIVSALVGEAERARSAEGNAS